MLKGTSKRKQRRSELEEVKEEEKLLKDNKQQFLQDYKKLKTNKGPDSQEMACLIQMKNLMKGLQRQGYVDLKGVPLVKK